MRVDSSPPPPLFPRSDWDGLVRELALLRRTPGVTVQTLGEVDGSPVEVVRLSPPPGVKALRVAVFANVHGDEPSAAPAALALVRAVLEDPRLRGQVELTVVPCVNPEGFQTQQRRNQNDQLDLNREVNREGFIPEEIELILPVLDEGPFDLAIDLHASWAQNEKGQTGFFAIQNGTSREVVSPALKAFAQHHPVLDASTERYTLLEPGLFQSQNPGTLKSYLYENGTPHSYTLEAAQQLPYAEQVEGLRALSFALMDASLVHRSSLADVFDSQPSFGMNQAPTPVLPSVDEARLWM